MSRETANVLGELKAFSATSNITLITPSSPDFSSVSLCYVRRPEATPIAVARPTSVEAVAALIRFCTSHGIDFVIRSGGLDSAGRSQVAGALSIDLRLLNGVSVSADRKTASVGGGISARDVATALEAEGLVTPTGTAGSLGYVGWATLGGYGLMSANFGLGCDQIVAAKIVTAEGKLLDADAELLKGIRGAAPAFGVVVELTIKVYELKQILAGMIIYESSDFPSTLKQWMDGFNELSAAGRPAPLGLMPVIAEIPQLGRALVTVFLWSSPDQDEGRKWLERAASLGTALVNTVAPTTISGFLQGADSIIVYGSYGRNHTLSVRALTPEVVRIITEHANELPGGGAFVGIHMLTGAPAQPNSESVFSPRVDHFMLELVSVTAAEELVGKCTKWATAMRDDLIDGAKEVALEGGYVPLLAYDDSDWLKIYGDNYQFLLDLKRKYDPQNVFKNTVPRLIV